MRGGLTASYPIDVPAGPGGLTPPLQLTYSSASVAQQHNPQSAAPWVGEGWNLSLGAVSWAEHYVPPTWERSWQLSDPFGTSVELIPPNIGVASYFDDDPTASPCDDPPGINGDCPVIWHTSPETHAEVVMYIGPQLPPDGAGTHAPCFRVFLPNGLMEEFGCTADSLQYYYVPGQGDYISNWLLDLITDPHGNQIHVTYLQKQGNKNGHTYIEDAVLATVEYDDPTCHNTSAACGT
jgi:hypothetical protein